MLIVNLILYTATAKPSVDRSLVSAGVDQPLTANMSEVPSPRAKQPLANVDHHNRVQTYFEIVNMQPIHGHEKYVDINRKNSPLARVQKLMCKLYRIIILYIHPL